MLGQEHRCGITGMHVVDILEYGEVAEELLAKVGAPRPFNSTNGIQHHHPDIGLVVLASLYKSSYAC